MRKRNMKQRIITDDKYVMKTANARMEWLKGVKP